MPDDDVKIIINETEMMFCLVFLFIRCEDMVDVRRLKMLQMVQLFKCEEDAAQVKDQSGT